MKKIKSLLIILGVSVLLSSCDALLDSEPTSSITVASFWTSEDDASGALYGMYVDFRDVAVEELYYLGEARSDVLKQGTTGTAGWDAFYNNTLSSTDGVSWANLYTLVNDANLILKYVPDVEFTSEDDKNQILAEAYTMRAFAYFTMTKSWGDLIIRTEPTEDTSTETLQKERSAQSEVFDLIKSDLDEALDLFPDTDIDEDRAFWSAPAANALKADVYLWTGKLLDGGTTDITTALNALNTIDEADATLELLDDYSTIFDYDNKGNNEVLMSVCFLKDETDDDYNYFYDMYLSAVDFPSESTVDETTYDAIYPSGGNNIVVPTDYVKSLFSDDDIRKDASFYDIYQLDDNGDATSYYRTVVTKCSGTVVSGERLFIDNVILYRYADILLMKAEAKNALDEDPSSEINEVRARAYGSNYSSHEFVSGTQDENDEEILAERLRELAFEGKRWWDLLRFEKVEEMVESVASDDDPDHLLLWPIYEDDLSLETLVVQNDGYN